MPKTSGCKIRHPVSMMKQLFFSALLLSLVGIGGVSAKTVSMNSLESIAYDAADALEDNIILPLDKTKPILFSTFVNLDDLESASPFGRLFAEQAASRFSQYGYKIIELKLRSDTIHMEKKTGELALSRDIDAIALKYKSQAILTGVYCASASRLYITIKLIDAKERRILSSFDFSVRLNDDLKKLLNHEDHSRHGSAERIRPEKNAPTVRPDESSHTDEANITEAPLSEGLVLIQPSSSIGAKIIQNRLARLGYYTREIHGHWDKHSKTALRRFKKNHGLPDTPAWDLAVQKRLFQSPGQ